MCNIGPIPVFIINLKKRTDRREHILLEFRHRSEFRPVIVEAKTHPTAAVGLWNTIRHILQDEANARLRYIIICEDDHQFSERYSPDLLFRSIGEAERLKADILCGGVSWFRNALPVSENLFWVDQFNAMQFTIVFRHFFDTILEADFSADDVADTKISRLTQNAFFIFPFLSTQKDFGYSDVTERNNIGGWVTTLFTQSMNKARSIKYIVDHYRSFGSDKQKLLSNEFLERATIPTYVICDPGKPAGRSHMQGIFGGKSEFSVSPLTTDKDRSGEMAYLEVLKRVVESALNNNEDVIIVCLDSHEFTEDYSKEFLFRNIMEAHEYGAEILSGAGGEFEIVLPVSKNRFWINLLPNLQFLILYRSVFKKIIQCELNDRSSATSMVSSVTAAKFALFPFISFQKSDEQSADFPDASRRLELVQHINSSSQY